MDETYFIISEVLLDYIDGPITRDINIHESIDSLDLIMIVMDIEDKFDITLPDRIENNIETVNDLVVYVAAIRQVVARNRFQAQPVQLLQGHPNS